MDQSTSRIRLSAHHAYGCIHLRHACFQPDAGLGAHAEVRQPLLGMDLPLLEPCAGTGRHSVVGDRALGKLLFLSALSEPARRAARSAHLVDYRRDYAWSVGG